MNVNVVGEFSGPDVAAVLAASLRLGAVDGGSRAHPGRLRDGRAGQRGPCGRPRRRAELGASRPERPPPHQQPTGRVPQQSHGRQGLSTGHADLPETARCRTFSVAEAKPDGVLPAVIYLYMDILLSSGRS